MSPLKPRAGSTPEPAADAPHELLRQAYEPETFRAEGHRLVDGLADHLARAEAGHMPVLPLVAPARLLDELPADFPRTPARDVVEQLLEAVARSNHLHHPGYAGHQVSAPVPIAALAELASALLNNGMAVYEMGQMSTVMERHVLKWMARRLGFPTDTPGGADGVLTHGGSIGNFTALLAARQARAGHDVWTEGQREPLAVLVSDQAHYSVARAVQCMGWGAGGAIAVSTDARYRMRGGELGLALASARAAGRRVIAVVGSCCSTATGSFDPLHELADFCEEHDLWLHVDGAHGASLALSRRHRERVAGIERADSVVWDLHKLMALPALNTAVLFREGRRSYESFAQRADYLFEDREPEEEWFNIGRRTMECTKRGLGLVAYSVLRGLGVEFFERNVDRLVELGARFAELLSAAPDFELATSPEANILCFRHVPAGAEDIDRLQAHVRERLLAAGDFYLVQARVRGRLWLRVALMNPLTSERDLLALIEAVRRAAG